MLKVTATYIKIKLGEWMVCFGFASDNYQPHIIQFWK